MKFLDGLGLVAVAAGTASGVALMSPGRVAARTPEIRYSLAPETLRDYRFSPAGRVALESALESFFGPHAEPRLPDGEDATPAELAPEQLQRGRDLYVRKCMHCHGPGGGGDGPTARFVFPPPRNFQAGKLKFTSTERTSPPTRDDILRVLQRGVAYTAMPSFVNEPREDLEALASYVQFLLMRGETEALAALRLDEEGLLEDGAAARGGLEGEILGYLTEEYEAVAQRWAAAGERIVNPPIHRPDPGPESLARGRELYLSPRTECSACHGEDGRGKGPNVWTREGGYKLQDDWGNEARPADLTRGIYRGGDRPIDLYRRIHQGVKGTVMPAFGDSLAPEQIWDLVNYVYSLRLERG